MTMRILVGRGIAATAVLVVIGTIAYASVSYSSRPGLIDTAVPFAQSRRLYDSVASQQPLPSYTELLANVWDPIEVSDQPFLWYIPKAGGLAFQKICARCLNIISASAKGMDTYNEVCRRSRAFLELLSTSLVDAISHCLIAITFTVLEHVVCVST